MDAQFAIQIVCEQRKRRAGTRAQHSAGCKCRRRVRQVRVDQVVGKTHVEKDHAETKEDASAHADQPIRFGAVGPCKPEEADGKNDGAEHRRREARFGWGDAVIASYYASISPLVDQCNVDKGKNNANDQCKKRKRCDALGPSADLLEDDGVGCEKEKERAVDDGEEEGKKRDDGLVDEHDPRTECTYA